MKSKAYVPETRWDTIPVGLLVSFLVAASWFSLQVLQGKGRVWPTAIFLLVASLLQLPTPHVFFATVWGVAGAVIVMDFFGWSGSVYSVGFVPAAGGFLGGVIVLLRRGWR